jgi:hypothetical protein
MSRYLIVLFTVIAFSSCRLTRKIQTVVTPRDTTVAVVIPKDNSHNDSLKFIADTYRSIQSNHINFNSFSAKIDVDYEDGNGKKYNVNAHVRMAKDSVIWISITAVFGIEGLRAYITPDSVKIMNKQDKTYTARSVEYLQDVTALPLDLPTLQDLLVGNVVYLDSNNITSYTMASNNNVGLVALGDFFKNLLIVSRDNGLPQSSKLDDLDQARNRTCYLTYDGYEKKDGIYFSSKRRITVAEEKKLDIKLDFKQYSFNETLSFPFSVPKNYKSN